jgi:hypothetical protein
MRKNGSVKQKTSRTFSHFIIAENWVNFKGIAQNLSNKFGVLPGVNVGIFWYNSLAFTRQCSSALRKKCDETAGRGTGGHQMGGKHA